MLPFLKYLVGKGRPANWLLRNKWNSLGEISQVKDTPLLLFSSLQVRFFGIPVQHSAGRHSPLV